jgi:hypothetical protein
MITFIVTEQELNTTRVLQPRKAFTGTQVNEVKAVFVLACGRQNGGICQSMMAFQDHGIAELPSRNRAAYVG